MPNVQEASRPRVAGWHSWRELVLTVVLIVAGDFAFRLVGQAFLFSPWAASGDLIIAEELYWLAGRRAYCGPAFHPRVDRRHHDQRRTGSYRRIGRRTRYLSADDDRAGRRSPDAPRDVRN